MTSAWRKRKTLALSGHPDPSGQPRTARLAGFSRSRRWRDPCCIASVPMMEAWRVEARRRGNWAGGAYSLVPFTWFPAAIGLGSALLLPLAGCRSSLDLCADGCSASGESSHDDAHDSGGASGRDTGGSDANERAGAAGTPAGCETDRDCDDGLSCNGDERCQAGACRPGTPLVCEGGTTCDEADPENACVYATASPWLVLLSNDKVLGLPTAELANRQLLTLGERASNGQFEGLSAITFSPSGRHALFEYAEQDFGEEMLELGFTRGMPGPLHDLTNLPNWGTYSEPVFSHDGAYALLSEYDSGAYLIDLSGAKAASSPLNVPVFRAEEVAFCSNNHTWLRKGSPTVLYTLTDGQPAANDLGHDDDYDVQVSPDARKIWLGGDTQRLVACSEETLSQPLGFVAQNASFSPDSRWLLLSLEDGSTKLLSVAESLETTEVWSGVGVVDSTWANGSGSLLLRQSSDVVSRYGYFDLSEKVPALKALPLDARATTLGCGQRGCLAQISEDDDPLRPLLFQPFDASSAPSSIGSDPTRLATVMLADFERGRLMLQRATATGNELTLTDFAGTPERHLFDWRKGSAYVEQASDGTGIAIRVEDDFEFSNFWVAFPTKVEQDPDIVSLGTPAFQARFQPWP